MKRNPSVATVIKTACRLTFSPKLIIRDLFHVSLWRGLYLLLLLLIQLGSFFIIYTNHHFLLKPDTSTIGLISLFAGVTQVLNITIEADGKLTNYFWAILNNVSYIYVSFANHLYGEVYVNSYFLILEFLGMYVWTYYNLKNQSKEQHSVAVKSLSYRGWLALAILILVCYLLMGIFLMHVPFLSSTLDPHPWLDALSAVTQFFAQALMVMRYGASQWSLWSLSYVAEIVLWSINFNPVIIALWAASLINAGYGWYRWQSLLKN